MLKKDISLALRRGTIAQVSTLALEAAQRAAEEEPPFTRWVWHGLRNWQVPFSYCVGVTSHNILSFRCYGGRMGSACM
jgi:hypothetical protein